MSASLNMWHAMRSAPQTDSGGSMAMDSIRLSTSLRRPTQPSRSTIEA
uniref:Uncharacterized protein n=1 Tax=Arundo donax TaxID=35708 RepID=A0A0A9HSH4_ARUDO